MIDDSYTKLIEGITTATKVLFPANKVIRGNVNGNEPNDPYISVKIIRDTQIGLAQNNTLLSATNDNITISNYEVLVQFTFTSIDPDDAANLAKTFNQYLNTPTTREVFRQNNLSKMAVSTIRNISYKRETTWTQCYNIDVTFNYAIATTQTMTPIEVVEITDSISGEVFTVPPDVIITP